MADFHFIRPLWLLLLLLVPVLYFTLRHKNSGDSGWASLIPEQLLSPVMRRYGASASDGKVSLWPALFSVVVLSVALAGPSWREAPTPLKTPGDSLVIVLDLSLSMLATDLEPDRLTRAKRKIRDILTVRDGSLTGLVVYAGDAHVVTPLTDDSNTITGMLNVLDPVIMPAQGNRADLAVSRARALLEQGAPGRGRILLITDGVSDRYQQAIRNALKGSPYTLSTLAAGTRDGGPIPLARRGFIRDNGNIVITRTDPEQLAEIALTNGGLGHELTLDDGDIHALNLSPAETDEWLDSDTGLKINRWQDDGYWLLWLALPLLLLGWRRGAFTAIALVLLPAIPQPAAADWGSFWQREDQRGLALIQEDPVAAAEVLTSPEWRGAALYKAERFEEAAKVFSQADSALAHYNRGNALARAGQFQEAIEAYDKALNKTPGMEDAIFNRQLVKDLLEQQQNQQSGQSQDNQNTEDSNQSDGQQQGSPSDSSGNGDTETRDQPQGPQASEQQQSEDQTQEQSGQASKPEQQPDDAPENTGAQAQPTDTQPGNEQAQAQAPEPVSETPLTQSQEQSLRRVPDNPGGLLQRKFLQQYQQRQTPSDEGDTPW